MYLTVFGMNRTPQPRKCPDCGRRLPNAIYRRFGKSWDKWDREGATDAPHIEKEHYPAEKIFHIICECGVILVWMYPNVWKYRHFLPIFQTLRPIEKEIVQIA